MAGSSGSLHENEQSLKSGTIDRHRAIVSIMEELEAIDWYDQRVDAATDEELKGLLAHNRDEEKEHAAMMIEWLRRRDPAFDEQLRTYLFTEGPILGIEAVAEAADATDSGDAETPGTGGLGIGSLRDLG